MSNDRQQAVLVTGARSPIGSCVADHLAMSFLVVRGVKGSTSTTVADGVTNDKKSLVWGCDLESIVGIDESLVGFLEGHRIRISHFIHAAGVVPVVPVRAITPDILHSTLNVNFASAAMVVKSLIGRWNRPTLETVTFLSSVSAHRGVRGYGAYSASKAALEALMRTLAVELAPRVRVNALAIGAVDTGRLGSEARDVLLPQHPLGLGNPTDVAGFIDYLVSKHAKWITGHVFGIDGGFLAR